ncbi:MAG: cytochrome c biogenesis protein CcsA [Phycisphaerales bacterium]
MKLTGKHEPSTPPSTPGQEHQPRQRSEFLARLALVVAIIVALVLAFKARGQSTAPAGNEHPPAQMLSGAQMPNPFGEPARAPAMDTADKWAFARRVNLDALRDLAVQHNSRIKIVDTLAREVIGSMTNRKDYYDVVPGESTAFGSGEKRLAYDPLFTFLDMIIDPAYYVDRPVIGVNYLPARDAFLDLLHAHESPEWFAWRRVGRLSPREIASNISAVASAPSSMNDPMQKALGQAHEAVQLFAGLEQDLILVPAASTGQPWSHLGRLPADSPAGRAARDLGKAWRAGDAAGVETAARALAAELPRLSPDVYPTTRRSIERVYNAARPFDKGVWFYAGALLSLILAFGTGRRWLLWTGVGFLTAAVALHGFGFAARCIIAERFAIQNQFESMTGVSLFAAAVGVVLAISRRQPIFAAAASAAGFLILIAATQMPIPGYNIDREAAILNTSVLLKYHVTTVLTSYGLISLGMVVSLFYLASHYGQKLRVAPAVPAAAAAPGPGPTIDAGASPFAAAALGTTPRTFAQKLADLDKAQMIILQLAFWTLGVGILLGAWWADHSWGRWWAFDPKELWALLTWIVYLVVIHIRFAAVRDRGLTTAWLSLLGFGVMLFCYFGVNLLLPGLHAYA